MRKLLILNIMLISLLGINLNVNADGATNAIPGQPDYENLKALYNTGITTSTINDNAWVTIYGKSVCDSNGSCKHTYVENIEDFKNVLKKSVKCSGGQKNILYNTQISSGKADNYTDADGNNIKNATVYWSEMIHVTCTNETNGGQNIVLEQTSNQGSGGGYNSADPGQQKDYGVNTYFIVLGSVALVSYAFMTIVKKHNLFKKI